MEPNIPSQPTPSITPEIQSPVTQSIPPSSSSPSSKNKYVLLGLLVLLIIAVIGGGTYYLGVVKQQPVMQKNNNVVTATTTPSVTPISSLTPIPSSSSSPTQTPISITDPTANWKTYVGTGFSLKYPVEFSILENTYRIIINHNIVINKTLSDFSATDCKGDCPLITQKQSLTINNYLVNKIQGSIGSIGGNIPQSYITYEIKNPTTNKYFEVTLYELPQDAVYENLIKQYPLDRTLVAIPSGQDQVLMQIISTFKFTQ